MSDVDFGAHFRMKVKHNPRAITRATTHKWYNSSQELVTICGEIVTIAVQMMQFVTIPGTIHLIHACRAPRSI
jgi:hypothetical protein